MENLENENAVQNEAKEEPVAKRRKKRELHLKDFLKKESIKTNAQGQFVPNNNQLKDLVERIDEENGKLINLAKIDTSEITSMKGLFKESTREDYSGIERWNTSKVESFYEMFYKNQFFNADISNWDVSACKNFFRMFEKTEIFDQPIGAKWHTKSATNMCAMFGGALNFNNGGQAFGDNWKTDLVEDMAWMFSWAYKFNAPGLHLWNMANIKSCARMFQGAESFNQPLDKWDLSKCETMDNMFNDATSFNQDLSAWGEKIGKVKNMGALFKNAKALTINFLGAWKIPNGCNTRGIITGSGLEGGKVTKTTEPLYNFVISELQTGGEYKKFGETKGFLKDWVPSNIQERFHVYLTKYDDNDELVAADEATWQYAFCDVFEQDLLIERIDSDDERVDEAWLKKDEEFSIWQARKAKDFAEFEENKAERIYGDDNLEIFFSTQDIWIVNTSKFNMSETVLSIVNAMVLVKAYKWKMRVLDDEAKNYKTAEDLDNSYEKLCQFDLHAYQNTPFVQHRLKDPLLINVWRGMSDFYMVDRVHAELKETIRQISELVNSKKQDRMDMIMFWVAIWSAIAALLALVPLVQEWL